MDPIVVDEKNKLKEEKESNLLPKVPQPQPVITIHSGLEESKEMDQNDKISCSISKKEDS